MMFVLRILAVLEVFWGSILLIFPVLAMFRGSILRILLVAQIFRSSILYIPLVLKNKLGSDTLGTAWTSSILEFDTLDTTCT